LLQCPHIVFPSCSSLVEYVFFTMVTKTMELHVLLHLELLVIMSTNFNLWMFRGRIDTFFFIVNYLNEAWTFRLLLSYLKCMKQMEVPWLCNSNLCFKKLDYFIGWLFLWKMRATTWEPWLQHYDQSLIVYCSSFYGFMRVLASNMWCFKCVNMWWMM
jgi:hypothetical protein